MNIVALKMAGLRFWQQRSPSERRALRLLSGILIAALVIQTLWSLEHARRSLSRQLPVLAEQAEKAHALRDTWRQLNAGRETQSSPRADTSRAEAHRRVSELGQAMTAEWTASGELLLKGQADFSVWLKWLAEIHRDYQLVLSQCRVASANSGLADIEARLTPTKTDP